MADFQPRNPPNALEAPSIQIVRNPGGIALQFSGSLWEAPNPAGPWTRLPGATSPHTIDPTPAGSRFFRAGEPTGSGVFDERSVLDWTLTGPLQRHFELAFAGMPDGIFPPVREKPYFPGSVGMAVLDLPVRIRVRGNSSLQECPFPKLKLKVSKEDRAGTPFADAREINIGSHCAEGGDGNVGRLRDERAAYREALAYEISEELGFTTPRVRRARIQYHDTTPPGADPDTTGWTLTRQALLLENAEVVGERLGGRALDDEEVAALTDARFPAQLVTELRLFHALLGNWDYGLSETGRNLWNTDVIALPDGSLIPMAGDFDLASWVTGRARLNAPRDYRPELPDLEREAFFQVDSIRKLAGEALFTEARTHFVQRRAALEARVESADTDIDAPGRTNARDHLKAFYLALD